MRHLSSWPLFSATSMALSLTMMTLFVGCGGDTDPPLSPTPPETPAVTDPPIESPTPLLLNDKDRDGVTVEAGDCNDNAANIFPGATEIAYDGIDQDCNGEDLTDYDQDGYDSFQIPGGDDCNDVQSSIHPGATEVADGIDNNCNGQIDEGIDSVDNDGDGVSEQEGDCNDLDPNVNPNSAEVAYDGIDQDCSGSDLIDVDQDGFPGGAFGADCDDENPNTFPGAEEYGDGADNDCDDIIDEGLDTTDDDLDGFSEALGDCDDTDPKTFPGGEEIAYDGKDQDCSGSDLQDVDGDGYLGGPQGNDCNDARPDIHPGTVEIPYDGVDQDCSGQDENDLDDDGFIAVEAGGSDCDDEEATVFVDAPEVPYDGIDQDCDNADLTDVDGDGFESSSVEGGRDCQDTVEDINPSALEICDGQDNNCDGVIDTDAQDRKVFYTDSDGDGYGDPNTFNLACSASVGQSENDDDCNDKSAQINPAAAEVCDQVDNNCNLQVDEGVQKTFYADTDGDTFGDPNNTRLACVLLSGYVMDNTDCNDTSATVNPVATEKCNQVDDNCNQQLDEGVTTTYYLDADADGYGIPTKTTQACSVPEGYASNSTDCKDTNDQINPGASERCNGIDDNCNSSVDENVVSVYYKDADGDGFGDKSSSLSTCNPPSGYVSSSTDCNDAEATIFPGAAESCNGKDDNCNGTSDEGVKSTFYLDADNDGQGGSTSQQACSASSGYVSSTGDCNDSDNKIFVGASELCDSKDNDCDGQTDESAGTTYYRDADGDGYGTSSTSVIACSTPSGYVSNSTDCNDTNNAIKPNATETCDGVDQNCNGSIDEGLTQTAYYQDLDGDGYGNPSVVKNDCAKPTGYVSNSFDCRDTNDQINPAATETCNGVDEDCDGTVDDGLATTTYYQDSDGDGYGNPSVSQSKCSKPTGYVADKTDCNDTNAAVKPGAVEQVNGIDDDCDGIIDILASCKALKTNNPSSTSGVYKIDPDGAGSGTAFDVYCNMTDGGGGWTLIAIITNGDSNKRWNAYNVIWVDTSVLGDATKPSVNSDAKSRAYSELNAEEVMVMASGAIEVQTGTTCLGAKSMRTIMNQNSQSDSDCALSCTTTVRNSVWSQSYTEAVLKFRCMDNDCNASYNGYVMSCDDNSMITTLINTESYHDYNFGLGGGYGSSSDADFDSVTDDYGNPADTNQRLLYVR
ncbi:MAG: MopE-related protein [Myxococcota bacterium]